MNFVGNDGENHERVSEFLCICERRTVQRVIRAVYVMAVFSYAATTRTDEMWVG